jgi:ubiquinone/menaquinone biosynthesis C-methylase UbiE
MTELSMKRNFFLYALGQKYLPAIPDLHARLLANPPARIAVIGCALGWSSIGIALAYPNVWIDGFDLDGPSIEEAWCNASSYALTDRVTFHVRDAASLELLNGSYDLVTAFESIDELGNPVSVLRTMRRLAGDRGYVIVLGEHVGDAPAASGDETERMLNGWSELHDFPAAMAEDQLSAETDKGIRTATLRRYAQEAGFRDVEVQPLDNYFFTLYRLHG